MRYYLEGLSRNVRAGTRLALFLPLRPHEYRASPVDYAVLVAFAFVLWVVAAGVRAGFAGSFDPAAISVYLSTVGLVLLAALVLSLVYRDPGRLALFAVALTAADPFLELVGLAIPYLGARFGAPPLWLWGFLVWTWLVALRAVFVCGGRERPQLYQGLLTVSVVMAVAWSIVPRADVWVAPPMAQEDPRETLADERLFHLQGELIERALAAVRPGRPGEPELYFVGFAPDASQDVFLREMRFVRKLFDERFGTAGRSIALAASQTALEELPIASVTNLQRAVTRVSEAMNPDEDVLFLYLSAHGDREHRLSAVQPPLALAGLTPTALARMLEPVRARWRVIVVSACYSGGYVEPLRDENTMVITAAAADRSSFGCEAGRDFTYFGEAFFRDALAKTRSFSAAFDLAKDIVAKREAAEKLTPSNPQVWIGAGIAARLKELAH